MQNWSLSKLFDMLIPLFVCCSVTFTFYSAALACTVVGVEYGHYTASFSRNERLFSYQLSWCSLPFFLISENSASEMVEFRLYVYFIFHCIIFKSLWKNFANFY